MKKKIAELKKIKLIDFESKHIRKELLMYGNIFDVMKEMFYWYEDLSFDLSFDLKQKRRKGKRKRLPKFKRKKS